MRCQPLANKTLRLNTMNLEEYRKGEDAKYSWLYNNGYPPGSPSEILERYSLDNPNLAALDIGCGPAVLAPFFNSYVGLDISKSIIDRNREIHPDKTFIHGSLDNMEIAPQARYNVVFCSDVLEHIPESLIDICLTNLFRVNTDAWALVISCRDSKHRDKNGGSLHLTIKSFDYWIAKIEQHRVEILESIHNRMSMGLTVFIKHPDSKMTYN